MSTKQRSDVSTTGDVDPSPDMEHEKRWSSRTRLIVSVLIAFQFSSLVIALFSNRAPSALQGELLRWLGFYQVSTAQDYPLLPTELITTGTVLHPLSVEVRLAGEARWTPIPELSGYQFSNSRWRSLARILRPVIEEQPDEFVLPEFAAQVVRQFESQSRGRTVDALRIYAPTVLSYDEHEILRSGQESLLDQSAGAAIYAVNVVHEQDEISIVPTQSSATTAPVLRQTATGESP